MPRDINYDEVGNAKTVLLPYEEYQSLIAKPDERAIISQTARKICELIQEFARHAERIAGDQDTPAAQQLTADDFNQADQSVASELNPAPADVRRYNDATGYYEGDGFRVLKGSKATGSPSPTFENLPGAQGLRCRLIKTGILVRNGDWGDYTFTQDYVFSSSSAAACIVDGNSRSGPKAWGPRT